jgi:integrase/recombinase XerD
MSTTPLAPLLQYFFTEHLCSHKQVSPHTITAYRDTFRLLLQFLQKQIGKAPTSILLDDLDAPAVLAFLGHVEKDRNNLVRSRNSRLTAIRSFMQVVALREPSKLGLATRVLAIPVKRAEKRLVGYLTQEEMKALLAAPDRSQWIGRRDHALLLTMYNSGARLSEVTAMHRPQVRFGSATYLEWHGKGRKERAVPLWNSTAQTLRVWFRELENKWNEIAFPTIRGTSLSADGMNYLLQQAVQHATAACPSLAYKRVTPHMIRHSTAMHLLQSGVDITVIALWLGHESIETTHIYLEADLATKEKALQKTAPPETSNYRFKPGDPLLRFLASL